MARVLCRLLTFRRRDGSEESLEEQLLRRPVAADFRTSTEKAASTVVCSPTAADTEYFLRSADQRECVEQIEPDNPPIQTVTYFDWDDTLFCTTHFNRTGCPVHQDAPLRELARTARRLLEAALARGPTYIITNAANGWVQASAKVFMPEVLPVLEKVSIVSARAAYSERFPDRGDLWKTEAFLDTAAALGSGRFHVLAFGDSDFELDAAQALGKALKHAVVKTVKFRRAPCLAKLAGQQRRLLRQFAQLAEHGAAAALVL